MSSWYLAPALRALTDEINREWPKAQQWPTVSIGDGWIGDTSHQARKSDHNPDYSAGGVVRAVDIGIAGRNAQAILDAVIGDRRVWYVIHKGIIYNRKYGWAAHKYTGSNPHNTHIHVSLLGMELSAANAKKHETDTGPWFTGEEKTPGVTRFLNAPTLARRLTLADKLAKRGSTPKIRNTARLWAKRHRRAVRWTNLRKKAYRTMRKQEVK